MPAYSASGKWPHDSPIMPEAIRQLNATGLESVEFGACRMIAATYLGFDLTYLALATGRARSHLRRRVRRVSRSNG